MPVDEAGRRAGRPLRALLLVLSLTVLAGSSAASAAAPRLNVLLVLTDDQSYTSLERMPYLWSHRVDRFTNAHLNNAICCPIPGDADVRAVLAPHRGRDHRQRPEVRRQPSLVTWLADAGYATGFFGKYHLGASKKQPQTYVPPGWDEWVDHKMQGPGNTPSYEYYDYTLNVNGTLVPHGSAPEDYSTDVLADFAVDFVRPGAASRPWFSSTCAAGAAQPLDPGATLRGRYRG